MSFGFGVGDFIAVIQVATKIRKRFSDAPTQFQSISDEVKSLSILLSDVAVYADTWEETLGLPQTKELKTIVKGSRGVLEDLESLLARHDTLSSDHGRRERYRVKRLWERLTFDSRDVTELRTRLISNITLLDTFLRNIMERNTQKSIARLDKHIDEQEQDQILDWISMDCERHTDRLNWLLHRREPGTRKWLFESPEWHKWTSDEGRGTTLFCPGIPGAGKTHTSAMVIERLYSTFPADEVGIAFIFCDYQRSTDTEHIDLARNLLRMILERPLAWPAALRPAYESAKRARSEVSLDDVFRILEVSMLLRRRNFVIIDAMDELHTDARDVLVPKLFELQRRTGLNIFATSRDIGRISDLFSGAHRKRIKATGEDIEQYLSTHMATLPNFVSRNADLQTEIKTAVIHAAGEMFLLADLHLLSLKTKPSPKALRKALQGLSSGPDSTKEALEKAMQRVTSQPQDTSTMALQALMILTMSRRPLAVNELCHALAIDLEDLESGFDAENIPPIDYVLSSCAGMVIVEVHTRPTQDSEPENRIGAASLADDSLIKLAHKSIRDYLSSTQSRWFPHAKAQMAAICRIFKQGFEKNDIDGELPFLNYAQDHWAIHHYEIDPVISTTTTEEEVGVKTGRKGSFPLSVKQAGERFALRQLALELQGMRDPLLLWACRENRINLVEILLALSIDSFLEPLNKAQYEVDTNKDCGHAWCPAHGASQDIYPSSSDLCTRATEEPRMIDQALVMATRFSRQKIVEILVAHGASLAGRDHEGFTALGVAAREGHSDVLGWLLGQESMHANLLFAVQQRLDFAQLDVYKKWSLRPTSQPPRTNYNPAMKLKPEELLTGRVSITPLAAAVLHGHEVCVNRLIQWMQNHHVEATKAEWKVACINAMLCAMYGGHATIMRMLLPFVEVNSTSPGFGRLTPLHFAVTLQNAKFVRLILREKSVDLERRDINGRSALGLAAAYGSKDVIHEFWACGVAQMDPTLVLEALFESRDTMRPLFRKEFSKCCPDGLFAADTSGYSCFDKFMFSYLRGMSDLEAGHSQQSHSINIGDIDPFDWIMPDIRRKTIQARVRRLANLGIILLDPDNSCLFARAGHQGRECFIGTTSLYFAMASCSYALLCSLLQLCPASVREVDSEGRTILTAAFVRGHRASIVLILNTLRKQQDTSIVNAVTGAGLSALSAAISNWLIEREQLHLLLTFSGFDLRLVFHEDGNGICPLMALVMITAEHTISEHNNLDPFWVPRAALACDKLYEKCLQIFNSLAASRDCQELANRLARLSRYRLGRTGVRFLDFLCQMPGSSCLEIFLQLCPSVRSQLAAPDASGATTLIHASRTWRHNETIRFLLNTHEVNVGHRDEQGRTALSHIAEHLGQFSDGGVASMLIEEHGQDPLSTDNRGWSPLLYAVSSGNVWEESPYHQLLRDSNSLADWIDDHGSTPLHLAVKGRSPLAIRLLLQHSSSSNWLNAVDSDGLVPLAHFFMIPWNSKHPYRLRHPCREPGPQVSISTRSGVKERIDAPINVFFPSAEDELQYHRASKEAMQMMLNRPDILPDIPDVEGKTPLWHALKEWQTFAYDKTLSFRYNGFFSESLRSSIVALCARDDVDPLQSSGLAKTPLELVTELHEIYHGGSEQLPEVHNDENPNSSPPGDANDRAKMREMVNALRISESTQP